MKRAVRTSIDADRITTVWLDSPGKSVNTLSPQMLAELGAAVRELEQLNDADRPAGVIFASVKPNNFIAGADLFALRQMNAAEVDAYLAAGQALCDRIAGLAMPTVAAINGDCLGGGLELALACRYRVAAAPPPPAPEGRISIGLPELNLGLVPGWGGTVRLPRLIGLRAALPLILASKTLPPREAHKLGIVDELAEPGALLAAARRLVLGGPARRERPAEAESPTPDEVLDAARRETMALTHGNYPAAERVIEVIRAGYASGVRAGLEAERRALVELRETDAGRNLMRLFFLRHEAKRWAVQGLDAKPAEVRTAAVVGGGVMGSGIAHAMARAGIAVRLVEVDEQAAAAAVQRVRGYLNQEVASGRIDEAAAQQIAARVSPTTQLADAAAADVIVEAVVERLEVKRELFARLDELVRSDALLATNTSALSVTELAQATAHPRRVVGLHFFNPVPRMPLVEVVVTPASGAASLATAVALAGRLGKVAIRVNDAPGFLVNRLLAPYLAEALVLASEGAAVPAVDEALKRWGMPMGPFELLDQIGLDVSAHVLRSLSARFANRLPPPALLDEALARGWLGRKSGRGFYLYEDRGKTRDVNTEFIAVAASRAPASAAMDEQAIQGRLVLPMVNEAARVLAERVVDAPEIIDLATVLGLGLAPFRGGLAWFAQSVGIGQVRLQLLEMARRYGPRFAPAAALPLLVQPRRAEQPSAPLAAR